ncbi:hypothetical protein LPJ75_003577, partial [Coemansia sp. RSA 2598]
MYSRIANRMGKQLVASSKSSLGRRFESTVKVGEKVSALASRPAAEAPKKKRAIGGF